MTHAHAYFTFDHNCFIFRINPSTFSFINFNVSRLVTRSKTNWLNDGFEVNRANCTTRQQRREQKVISRRNDDLMDISDFAAKVYFILYQIVVLCINIF